MSALSIEPTYPTFTDSDGSPLDDGYVWIGAAGSATPIANPQTAYWDAALTQVVTQPVRTRGGYPLNAGAIGRLYVNGDYSILVRNRNGYDLYSAPNATERISSELVTFLQAGSGAAPRTAQSKMRDVVSVLDFGADPTGGTDSTQEIQAALAYAFPLALPVEFEGSFLVSGTLLSYTTRAVGSLHIVCKGNVTITVSAGATAFDHLLYGQATAANNGSITGGSLSINCNNKVGSAITFRHDSGSQSGTVNIGCPVEVLNCFNTNASDVNGNYGIGVIGDYETVVMNQPRVVSVQRTNTSGGSCQGIVVNGFSGKVTLNEPYVKDVLTPSAVDADGISLLGLGFAGTTKTGGTVDVICPTIVDCEGRSLKSICSDVTVHRPRVFRQYVVSVASSVDFDFQKSGGLLIEPYFEYRLNGATSPLSATHTPVVFQQTITDTAMSCKSVGGQLLSEVALSRYCTLTHSVASTLAESEVSGLRVSALGALATTVFTRAIVEFSAAQIEARSGEANIIVKDIEGPLGCAGLAYTSYGGGAVNTKLSVEVTNYRSSLAGTGYVFRELSGSLITSVKSFRFGQNSNVRTLMANGWTFNFTTLESGSDFCINIAAVTATNPPPWGTSGIARIETFGYAFTTTARMARVTVEDGALMNQVFSTDDGGATWFGAQLPTATAASIAAAANAINTVNKVIGRMVWDTTNNRMMVASGSSSTSAWWVADGSASVTPA